MLAGQAPPVPGGNLALEALLGAQIVWAGDVEDDELGLVAALRHEGVLGVDAGAVPDVADRIGGMLSGLAADGAMPLAYARQALRIRSDGR